MHSPFNDFVDVPDETIATDFLSQELNTLGPFAHDENFIQEFASEQEGYSSSVPVFPDELESSLSFMEHELSADQLRTAVDLNEKYKKLYKWEGFVAPILGVMKVDAKLLVPAMTDHKMFAQVFADWQDKNNVTTSSKGVLGLNSWTYFQKLLGFHSLSNKHAIDVSTAIAENKRQADKHWGKEREHIYTLLIKHSVLSLNLPLSDEFFAYAIADFQAQQKLAVDGILGPVSLSALRSTPVVAPLTITPSRWSTYIRDTSYDQVEALVDGKITFERLVKAIKTATGKGHYIYILGWMVDLDFCLIPNDQTTSMKALLSAVPKEVEIRVMIWHNPFYPAKIDQAKAFIDGLPNGVMVKDDATFGSPAIEKALNWVRDKMSSADDYLNSIDAWNSAYAKVKALTNEGSHHEKVVIVKGRDGLQAFCGGVDINPNRLDGLKGTCCGNNDPSHVCGIDGTLRSTTLHDVHAQVHGYAAYRLLQRFISRWDTYVASNIYSLIYKGRTLIGRNEPPVPIQPASRLLNTHAHVKVLHTYNHPTNHTIKDRSIRDTVRIAIQQAKSTIYMEDQYMISPEIAMWLNAKAKEPNFKTITIRTQDDEFAGEDILFPHKMRHKFERLLYADLLPHQKSKIIIEILNPHIFLPFHRKIHSKVWIIDAESDGVAIIGSANCNRRSMTHDTETALVIFNDTNQVNNLPRTLERNLRADINNTWTVYKHNTSVKDLDVAVQSHPAYNLGLAATGVVSVVVPVARVIPFVIVSALPKLWPLLWKIVDPFDDPAIIDNELDTTEEEQEFLALEASLQQELITSHEETTAYHHFEFDDHEATVVDDFEDETAKPCEGRVCWLKSVLNKQPGVNLVSNNTLDEATKKALGEWQLRNGLPSTKQLDAATERTMLEQEALEKIKTSPDAAAGASLLAQAKAKIEDWTSKAVVVKSEITSNYRDPRKLWAFVLHQMAFKRRSRTTRQFSDPESYLKTGAHFCIMFDGRIVQLHPLSRFIWHAQCISPRSVAVEFEGNFLNVKGQWWKSKEETIVNKDKPTQAQYESGRFLARYLKLVLGTTHILAHRQSHTSRSNDPGPDIWYNVGQWAINTLNLTDGGTTFKCGTGNPIPQEWRDWGNKSGSGSSKVSASAPNLEAFHDHDEFEEENPSELHYENEFTETIGEAFEMDELVKDWSKAIQLNRQYGQQLGWASMMDKLNDFLLPYSGLQNVSLGEEAFAQSVAAWQRQHGFPEKECDGVIGPKSWDSLRTRVQDSSDLRPVVQDATPGITGQLLVNTSIRALAKSHPRYTFTDEDARWLARFVEGEAGGQDNADSHAVIWAMFNRFGTVRHRVPAWTSFAVFLQQYSTTLQPVLKSVDAARRVLDNFKNNPKKFPVVYGVGNYPGTAIPKVQYKKHIDLQQKTWGQFNASVRSMVTRILSGQIPNPGIGIATHFLSSYVLLKAKRRREGIEADPSLEEWRQYTLQVAKHKKLTWIGERGNLNQRKNAFFIQPEFQDVPSDAISVHVTRSNHEFSDYEFMDEIEYLEALELEGELTD